MTILQQASAGLGRWIDVVAVTTLTAIERFVVARYITLLEQDDGTLSLKPGDRPDSSLDAFPPIRMADGIVADVANVIAPQLKGARVEIILQPGKFLFRPLELPARASEFIEGVVRAQIDRLTPWPVRDAAFGWTNPVAIASDRIALTIAATARSLVEPYVSAMKAQGAASIAVFAAAEMSGADAHPIKILEQSAGGALDIRLIRRMLSVVIVGAILIAAIATTGAVVVGEYFDGQRDELSQRAAELKSALRIGRSSADGASATQRALERRKHDVPSSTIALEALSKILPDDTYVSEFRIDGNKLQITGVSRNAPLLIRLIEQSPHFTRATFFAPTTRVQADTGDQFHIEADVRTKFMPGT